MSLEFGGSSLEALEFDLEGIDPNNPDGLIAELDELAKEEIEEMIEELEEWDASDLEDWEIKTLQVLKEYQAR